MSGAHETKWNTYTIAIRAVLIAMTIVLSRVLRIDVGFARFSLSSVCTIMTGLWLGPAAGGLGGMAADLLGSFLQGYAPNPLITVSAACWGILPGLAMPYIRRSGAAKKKKVLYLALTVLVTSLICSMGLTYLGLVAIGYDYRAIFVPRLLQFSMMAPMYALLVCLLYFSPVTAYLERLPGVAGLGRESGSRKRRQGTETQE